MKVLHVTPALPRNTTGPSKVVLGLCKALIIEGINVTIFTTDFDFNGRIRMPFNQPIDYFGVHIYYFPLTFRKYFFSKRLMQAIKLNIRKFDIVHIHGTWLFTTAIASHYCRRYNVPYLIRPRGNLAPRSLTRRYLLKKIYAYLIELKNLNEATAIHYLNNYEVTQGRIFGVKSPCVVIPNGVDVVSDYKLSSLRGKFRSKYQILKGKKVILFLGRIDPIKGLDRLTKVFTEVCKRKVDAYLIIAGPDLMGFTPIVKRWLCEGDVLNRVIFTGPLSDDEKYEAIVDADVFCLLSYQEGHSMALTEALMCGLPAVITKEVHFDEIVSNNAGFVTDGNICNTSSALITLLTQDSLRHRMGLNARKLILDNYTWTKVASQMVKVYENLLKPNLH